MWSRRMGYEILKSVHKGLSFDEFLKLIDNKESVDTATFKKACDSLNSQEKQLKEEYIIKSLIKRKKKEDGNDYPSEYPYPKYPKPRPYADEEEESEDTYPSDKKPTVPKIEDGKIDLEALIGWLRHLANFKKRPFNEIKARKILSSNVYRALRYDNSKFNPLILDRCSEILMSI